MMNQSFYEEILDSFKGAVLRRQGGSCPSVQAEAETWLQQFFKMEMLGRVSAHVAHDFNHVLTVMMGCSDKLLLECGPNNPKRKDLEAISQAAQRAARLVAQILEYTRKQPPEPVAVNLNDLLGETESMLRSLIGPHIKLSTQPMSRLKPVWANPGHIEQVLMNLVLNARDALPPEGGWIIVSTANIIQTSPIPHAHGVVSPGAYVRLDVTDTGIGMDGETRSHIFDVFYTTKERNKGTGLGLSIVQGIVRRYGGHIIVSSELGKGSAFSVYFPQILEEAVTTSSLQVCCV
ncbi:MAG: sensor histidine kinase [Gemmataceae bacterium]